MVKIHLQKDNCSGSFHDYTTQDKSLISLGPREAVSPAILRVGWMVITREDPLST